MNFLVYHRLGSKEIHNNFVKYINLRTLYGKWEKKQTEPISRYIEITFTLLTVPHFCATTVPLPIKMSLSLSGQP